MPWDPSDLLLQEATRSQKKLATERGACRPLSTYALVPLCSRGWRTERGRAGRAGACARSFAGDAVKMLGSLRLQADKEIPYEINRRTVSNRHYQ
jgi:hypothetical protein